MYADSITDSMKAAIDETNRRREIQQKYNEDHGITPQTIKKAVRDLISISKAAAAGDGELKKDPESMDAKELDKLAKELAKKMRQAAAELNFEEAARLRDRRKEVKPVSYTHLLAVAPCVSSGGPISHMAHRHGPFGKMSQGIL